MWLNILLGIIALVVIVFVWGILHLRHSQKVALREIARVQLDEIPGLCQECITGFREHFEETLDLENFEATAKTFSDRLDDSESLKKAFAKDEFYWYFVLPTGAFLGELLRKRVGGDWVLAEEDDGAPELHLTVGEEAVTTFPFDKIIKQVTIGDPGDVYAYLVSSTQLDRIVAEAESESDTGI